MRYCSWGHSSLIVLRPHVEFKVTRTFHTIASGSRCFRHRLLDSESFNLHLLTAKLVFHFLPRTPHLVVSLHPKAVQNEVHAIFIEGFGTAALVFIFFVLTHRRNPVPGAAVPALVGFTYGALVATLGPMTGYVCVESLLGLPAQIARSGGSGMVFQYLTHRAADLPLFLQCGFESGPRFGAAVGHRGRPMGTRRPHRLDAICGRTLDWWTYVFSDRRCGLQSVSIVVGV